ncbi:hypothetical protein JOS77_29380 [Chromobacterium haemolyticum]|nr:hypothetical protein JOS77_29380 [Chromobacterium haemolyticum]
MSTVISAVPGESKPQAEGEPQGGETGEQRFEDEDPALALQAQPVLTCAA